ncbi:acyl-CoA dehydrogenase family protein [Paenibacillus sp. 2RAB27]|uniref:acyl-CoA dehydrogenase family protein n=1 Tax=Paenibacillus sp. 2RAB27 TaxID=3232991 RepID=UPI003F97B689
MEQSVLETSKLLVERATALIPKLRERAEEMEKIKRMPEDTLNDLKESGILRILRPQIYSGLQLNMRAFTECLTEISRGCGSTGWFVSLTNIRDYMIAFAFKQEALDDIFASMDKDIILAGNFKPTKIEIKRVEGGYFIEEAQWPFVSGCLHADWGYFGFPIADEDGNMEMAIMVVPRHEMEILDDWHVMGLRGSGSNSVRVKNIFVPEHRVSLDRLASKGLYTSKQLKDIPLYQTSFVPSLTLSIVGPALGMAKAAMDIHMERVSKAGIGNTFYSKMNEAPITHWQIAQAQLKIDSAELHLYRAVDKMDAYAQMGKTMDTAEIVKVKADFGYVNQLCKEAIDLLVEGAGSVFAYDKNPLQRVYRDFMALHLHGFITASSLIETYGRVLCGQEPNSYFV